jgi:GNAT superfamily N-acetyltransferase
MHGVSMTGPQTRRSRRRRSPQTGGQLLEASKIRRAAPEEAEPLAALINDAFRVERFFKRGDRTTSAAVARMMRDGYFLAIDDEAGLVGVVFVRPTPPHGYFGMLAVEPSRQGHGIGRALIDAAERDLVRAGCTHAEIHVVNLREELPSYYVRLGYTVFGEQPFPAPAETSRPCHMIVMRKVLEGVTR